MRFYRGIVCLSLLLVGITASASSHRVAPDVTRFHEVDRKGIGVINRMAIRPDNHVVAIGTSTGLYLYDVATLNQISNFDFYSQPVSDVAWSPDGRYLAYTSDRGYIWDSVDGSSTPLSNDPLTQIAWSEDGNTIVGINDDANGGEDVYQWRLSNRQFAYLRSYTVASPGPVLGHFVWVGSYLADLMEDNDPSTGDFMIWRQDSPQVIYQSKGLPFRAFALSPDKKTVLLDEFETGLFTLDLNSFDLREVLHTDYSPDQLVWSVDGKKVFSLSEDVVDEINTSTWDDENHFQLTEDWEPYIGGFSADGSSALGFSPQGIQDPNLVIHTLPGWQLQKTSPTAPNNLFGNDSPSHEFGAVEGTDKTVSIYRNTDDSVVGTVKTTKSTYIGGWSPDSQHVAVIETSDAGPVSPKMTIVNIGATSVQFDLRLEAGTQTSYVSWLLDNRHFIVSQGEKVVILDDQTAGDIVYTRLFKDNAAVVRVMPDYFLAEDTEGLKYVSFDPKSYQVNLPAKLLIPNAQPVRLNSATWGHFLVAVIEDQTLQTGDIKVWDIASFSSQNPVIGQPIWDFQYATEDAPPEVHFLPGTNVMIAKFIGMDQVYNLDTGKMIGEVPDSSPAYAYLPDSGLLAMATDEQSNDIEIWLVTPDAIYPRPLITLSGHTTTYLGEGGIASGIADLYWRGDELISVGADATIRTWSSAPSAKK